MANKNKYKLLIQYDEDIYEKLVVHVNKFISEIETEYLGDIMITTKDIEEAEYGSDLIPTIDRKLFNRVDYNTRNSLEDYIVNMCNTMDDIFLYGNKTFTGIEIIEIKEE
jgi:hypothetical protein